MWRTKMSIMPKSKRSNRIVRILDDFVSIQTNRSYEHIQISAFHSNLNKFYVSVTHMWSIFSLQKCPLFKDVERG